MSAPDNPDLEPNSVMMTYHGLKSALLLIGLLEQVVEKKNIKLQLDILMDCGAPIQFKDCDYIQFSMRALANTLTTMEGVFMGESSSVEAVSFVKKLGENETRLQNIAESGDKDKPTGRRG